MRLGFGVDDEFAQDVERQARPRGFELVVQDEVDGKVLREEVGCPNCGNSVGKVVRGKDAIGPTRRNRKTLDAAFAARPFSRRLAHRKCAGIEQRINIVPFQGRQRRRG